VEFEDGNDLRPPKDSLVEFALKWRPDSLFRYVMGLNTDTEPLGRLQGMYQRQEALRSGRYWYKLVPGPGVATFSVPDPTAAAAVPTVSAASTVESAVIEAAAGGSEQDSDSPPAAADVAAKDSDVASDVADSADAAAADGSASDSTTAADTAAGEQSGAVNGTADADTAVAGKEDAPMAKSTTTKSGRGRKACGRGGSASAARSTRSANSTAANAAGGAAGAGGGGGSDSSSSNGTGSSANAAAAVGGSSSGSGAAASDAPGRRVTKSNSSSSNSNSSSTSTALTVTLDAELIWLDSANSYVLRALCPAGGSALAAATAARIPAQRCSLQEIPRWAEVSSTVCAYKRSALAVVAAIVLAVLSTECSTVYKQALFRWSLLSATSD
jgi:hypothetical protein